MTPFRVVFVIPGDAEGPSYIFAKREVDALERSGVVVAERFFLQSRTSPRVLRSEHARFRDCLRRSRADLVHAYYGTVTSLFSSVGHRLPLVITFQGSDLLPTYDFTGVRVWIGHLLSQISAVRSAAIICVSRQLRSRLWSRSCRARAEVVPTPVNLDVFRLIDRDEARRALDWSRDERVVLFNAGSAPRRKRLDLARGAVAEAERLGGKIRLVVMQNDVPPERVPMLMNAADCTLLASEAEGSPNTVKEAMACNLPVVSVPVGDVEERLRDVSPSRIVEPDARAMARALCEMLDLKQRSNGRTVVQRELSEPRMVERVTGIYAAVLGHRGVSAA